MAHLNLLELITKSQRTQLRVNANGRGQTDRRWSVIAMVNINCPCLRGEMPELGPKLQKSLPSWTHRDNHHKLPPVISAIPRPKPRVVPIFSLLKLDWHIEWPIKQQHNCVLCLSFTN